ncbi:homoserine dehydrogenase [Levilactobacillus zymae]|uniref:Homoserine dehydrogenase n=1 Tax=Levilactobacillus zymae TaxID=267363 RepID=A0A1Y6JWK4_9LACO|nr:homoserine dehydrogenase [Levilactobacillus zymae]SMS14327.1 Homoserine dehydrogenase [Levilactobacillus zymae]
MTTTIQVGMLGLGTVGSGVITRWPQAVTTIEETQGIQLQLTKVAVAHLARARQVSLPPETHLTDSITAVVADPQIQLVIEVMGTLTTAKQAIVAALTHGKSVITANKDLIATAGQELIALARREHCDLFYEASVAGGIPILRTLTDSYATDTVQAVTGILNGTANYILSAMTAGQSYDQALTAAQRAGYAESDPTNDVSGLDTTYKLMILGQLAFGQHLTREQIRPVGITTVTAAQCQFAAQHGWQIKLLAQAQRHADHLYCRVAPVAVPTTQILSQVQGVQNGVAIRSQAIGESLYTGPGAGSTATANSVLNDVLVATRRLQQGVRGTALSAPVQQLPVTNLAALAQSYLLFSDLAPVDLQCYAATNQLVLTLVATGVYRTDVLNPQQVRILRATEDLQIVPIAGTVQWPEVAADREVISRAAIG